MILLCYDGSPDAEAAIDRAGRLFSGSSAVVLTVWEPFIDVLARAGLGITYTPSTLDFDAIEAANRRGAGDLAEAGAARARERGLVAEPRTAERNGGVASAILDVADEIDADAIVLGTRGRGGVTSLLLGSVSHAVVQHADRPVVVVPSPAVIEARAASRG